MPTVVEKMQQQHTGKEFNHAKPLVLEYISLSLFDFFLSLC